MHDIDLIPTDVIIRMRDEQRRPRWEKLMKDAAARAVATKRKRGQLRVAARKAVAAKRRNPGQLREAALKAVATRLLRKTIGGA